MNRILLIFISLPIIIFAQTVNPDSTSLAKIDSALQVKFDKTKVDTSKKGTFDVTDVITSTAADSLEFDLKNKTMHIFGTGKLTYKQTILTGGKINVNFSKNELEAFGIIDTSDSLHKNVLAQTPVLTEGAETYEGSKLKYNFKTQKGFISAAKNEKAEQKYMGAAVKKVDKKTYFIKDGIYTTCKSDTPHTHFSAKEMKVIQDDKIFAKWIFMHIGGVPLPIPIPFAVFPNKTGRRSGIIAPTYGSMADRGQYFKNFGYFFALNDYMDLTLTGDYYMRGGWGTKGRFRYAERYNFSGNINAGYSKITTGEKNDPDRSETSDWYLKFTHNQTFTPTLTLTADLSFQSQNYIANNNIDYNSLLRKNIYSRATLTKRWEESGNSLTINYSRTQNLETNDITEILPNITFNKSQFYPFRSSSSKKEQKWYEKIGINYTGKFRNNRNTTDGKLDIRGGIQHSFGLSAPNKIGYFNLSPSFNYTERWYSKKTKQFLEVIPNANNLGQLYQSITSANADTLITKDVNDLNIIRTFNVGLSATTKIYGVAQPQMFGIEAIRHTITPTITYRYTPNFSDKKWGYYESYKDADGTYVNYDPYTNEVFGSGITTSESQSVSFSVGNVFEMKTMKDPTDTTSQQKKITLLNLNLSSGYNFAADSLKLSNLSLSYRTQIGDILNLNGSSSYTFYDYVNGSRINQYLASKGKGLFRITNLNLSVSTSLSGEKLKSEERTGKKEENDEEFSAFKKNDFVALREEEDTDFSIPWNLRLSYNYNFSKPTPAKGTINSNMGINLGFNLAKNWKIGMMANYDFQKEDFSAPRITVYRDLECWEMNFSWNPIGNYTGFRFEIRMKAPELSDVKLTKRKGLYSGR